MADLFNEEMRAMMDKTTALPGVISLAVHETLEYHAPQVESYAKTHAPWTDQTGNARNGLRAQTYSDGLKSGIVLYHQVPYGIWLEVRWDGKFGIIEDTIANQGPEVMRTIKELLGRIPG